MKIKQNKVPYQIPQPNNMGMIRYILAFGVLIAHFKVLTGYKFDFPLTSYSCVGAFFSLSGFLVYSSYLKKNNIKKYLISRAKRILPAYWSTILIFAIGLSFLSSLTISEYFTSSQFWKYLICNCAFLNFLEPTLPGLFAGFDIPAVNGSLWTMKVEWFLYLSVPVVAAVIHKFRIKSPKFFIAIYFFSIVYRILFLYLYESSGSEIYNILSRQFFGQLSYFYFGVLIYFYFDSFMQYKWRIILVSFLIFAIQKWIPYYSIILHPIITGVFVIWFSMTWHWSKFLPDKHNLSYNIYLTHFPVIQTLVCLNAFNKTNCITSLLICIILTTLMSYFINLIERRINHQ